MGNGPGFFAMAAVVVGVACGGSTSTSTDAGDEGADGGSDASGALDAVDDVIVDVVGDVLAKWQRLGLDNGSGPCPPQMSCSSGWVVSPDGHIAKTRGGDAGAAQMTPSDLLALDAIVSSAPFLEGMAEGFVCDRPPTDVFVSLRLDRDGVTQTQGVTGCVFSGPVGNLPRRVNELVTKY
jgi:hypothetical protein